MLAQDDRKSNLLSLHKMTRAGTVATAVGVICCHGHATTEEAWLRLASAGREKESVGRAVHAGYSGAAYVLTDNGVFPRPQGSRGFVIARRPGAGHTVVAFDVGGSRKWLRELHSQRVQLLGTIGDRSPRALVVVARSDERRLHLNGGRRRTQSAWSIIRIAAADGAIESTVPIVSSPGQDIEFDSFSIADGLALPSGDVVVAGACATQGSMVVRIGPGGRVKNISALRRLRPRSMARMKNGTVVVTATERQWSTDKVKVLHRKCVIVALEKGGGYRLIRPFGDDARSCEEVERLPRGGVAIAGWSGSYVAILDGTLSLKQVCGVPLGANVTALAADAESNVYFAGIGEHAKAEAGVVGVMDERCNTHFRTFGMGPPLSPASPKRVYVYDLAVDRKKNVLATGWFRERAQFGPHVATTKAWTRMYLWKFPASYLMAK